MSRLTLSTLLIPPISVTFTLFLAALAVAATTRSRSVTYSRASLTMGKVLAIDFVLNLTSFLTVAFTVNNAKGHALVFIPIIGIEVFMSSMVILGLFHRHDLSRRIRNAGAVAFLPLLLVSVSYSVMTIGTHGSWMAAANHLATTTFGVIALTLLPVLFLVAIAWSYVAVIASIRTYHMQICRYFTYRERPRACLLVVAAIAYLAFLCTIGVGVASFFNTDLSSRFLPFFLIYGKSSFFLFFTLFLVGFAQEYVEGETALCAIEKIEADKPDGRGGAEYPAGPSGEYESGTKPAKSRFMKLPAAPEGIPLMRRKMEKWQNDPRKFYLRDDINLLAVAEMVGVRPRFLSEYLNQVWGMNFNQYINTLRIEEAKRLILENTSRSFTDIANATGFVSVASLSKTFKRITGITPTRFREENL